MGPTSSFTTARSPRGTFLRPDLGANVVPRCAPGEAEAG